MPLNLKGGCRPGRTATCNVAVQTRDLVPQAPNGAYYYFELANCRCVDRNAGDLGLVIEIVEDGGGLLLRVEGENRELLVPFVESYLVKVDISRQLIELDLPLGLVETCTSKS